MKNRLRSAIGILALLAFGLFGAGCDFNSSTDSANGTPANAQAGAAVFTADVSAGDGAATRTADGFGGLYGAGGSAGDGIDLESYGVLGVQVLASGKADTAFTLRVPAFATTLGDQAVTFAASTTINYFDGLGDPVDNNYFFLRPGDYSLYYKKADGTIVTVTGAKILKGVTVTVEPGNVDPAAARFYLANDLDVAGTLKTASVDGARFRGLSPAELGPTQRGSLQVRTGGGILVRATGTVSTAGGADETGGDLRLYSYQDSRNGGILLNEGTVDTSGGNSAAGAGGNAGYVELYSQGYLFNLGTVRANGGNGGTDGGNGQAYSYLHSDSFLYNTGSIEAKGGNGATGNGGAGAGAYGNWFEVYSIYASTYNSGSIDVSGGNGAVYGGQGGRVWLANNEAGNLVNSGILTANGGNATSATTAVQGGNGGYLELDCYGGELLTSGNLAANGGTAPEAVASSRGGNGGGIYFYTDYGYDDYNGPDYSVSSEWMDISGNLSAKGGKGGNGGNGGSLDAYYSSSDGYDSINTGGVRFLGYRKFAANGGNGASGGTAADIYFQTYDDTWADLDLSAGGIVNQVALEANGGQGLDGSGGRGGSVDMENYDYAAKLPLPGFPVANVANSGPLSLRGGDGTMDGGNAGWLYLWGYNGLVNSGAIDADGGAGSGTGPYSGGRGGSLELFATNGNLDCSGAVRANGGDGYMTGGRGGDLDVGSLACSITGAVSANGGNVTGVDDFAQPTGASPSVAVGTRAGDGGYVQFWSYRNPTRVTGSVTVKKGTGGGLPCYDGWYGCDGVVLVSGGNFRS